MKFQNWNEEGSCNKRNNERDEWYELKENIKVKNERMFLWFIYCQKIECQNFGVSKYPTLNINGQHDQQAKPNVSNEWKKLVIM